MHTVVDIRLGDALSPDDEYAFRRAEIKRAVRNARKLAYDARRYRQISGSAELFYVLDRRLNWSDAELRSYAVDCLGTGRRQSQNADAAQWIVYSTNGEIGCEPLTTATVGDPAAALKRLRQIEFTNLIENDDVLFQHNRMAAFRLPSGQLSDFFLRVGNIQKSRLSVEKVCFWCLLGSSRVRHVMCESWTISTIAAELAQFLTAYWNAGGAQYTVTSSYLEAYPQEAIGDASPKHSDRFGAHDSRHLRTIFQRKGSQQGSVLFLISASSTGRLLEEIETLSADLGLSNRVRPLVLYALGDPLPEDKRLCDLKDWLEERELRNCIPPESAPDQEVLIDPSTYIPKYKVADVYPFSPTEHTDTDGFFERYGASGIFSVNRKGKTSRRAPSRHYSYHIDVDKMMDHPAFQARLAKKLEELEAVTAIVVVDTERNQRFRELVERSIGTSSSGSRVPVLSLDDLTSLDKPKLAELAAAPKSRLLFIDALVVSGSNMGDLSQAIRKAAAMGKGPQAEFIYLAGLARSYSDAKRRWLKFFTKASDHAGYNGRLEAVEEVSLPLFHEVDCPWLRELRAHETALDEDSVEEPERAFIEKRIRSLREGRDTGIRGPNVFFRRYGSSKFTFWDGSLFLDRKKVVAANARYGRECSVDDVDEADLVCAAAAAVHRWRTRANEESPYLNQLDVEEVTSAASGSKLDDEVTIGQTGFNETMLRGAIWRALLPNELSVRRSGSDASALLGTIFSDHGKENDQWELGGEAALAFGTNVRRILSGDQIEAFDWDYLLRLADAVGRLGYR